MKLFLFHSIVALACLAPVAATAAPAGIQFTFDQVAVRDFLRAVDREPLDDAQLATMASSAAAGMVRNTIKYVPESPRDGYQASLREIASTGQLSSDPFQLAEAVKAAGSIRTLAAAVEADRAAMARRIASRLAPHWKGQPPVKITVHLVIGGVSDGFVLDGDAAPEFYVALDKAGGDLAGLEQNITHESVHVLQRQLALRACPGQGSVEKRPIAERFLHDVWFEGVANFVADPVLVSGSGEYIDMWRSRYARNESPARKRENAWLFDSLLAGLRTGDLSWETASQIGFYGSMDSRLYFHGRALAGDLARAGSEVLSSEFSCHPERFFAKQGKLR